MGDDVVQFKALQVGTWFFVEEINIYEQLKTMLDTGTGTKVKVRLDRNGLKLTKITAIPKFGSEQKTPLTLIKNMFTNPRFPMCFFCVMPGPSGSLLKVVVIRCDKEMNAIGIVNYYRTLTYKRPTSFRPNERNSTNGLAAVTSVANDKPHNQTNGHVKDAEKIIPAPKTMEADAVTTSGNVAVSVTENKTETSKDIKKLAEEVNEIQQKTLKKHPATISRQEYIDAHEKVHQFATEVTKQNNRRYTVVNASSKNPSRYRYYFVNNDGTLTPAVRTRAGTADNTKVPIFMQRRAPSSLIRHTNKENEEAKASTLPRNAKTTTEHTADITAPVNESVPNKTEPSEEPVYAQVVKKRVLKTDSVNEETNKANEDATTLPAVPPRMVKFDNWSINAQNGSTKKNPRAKMRPHSFHQIQYVNTYVSKPIEQVYHNSAHRMKLYEGHRPRINSNTFSDGRPILVVHKGNLQI